jgi:hypothetical protein
MLSGQVFYFGCIGDVGHFVWNIHGQRVANTSPWGDEVDGGLCPAGKQVEGAASLHHEDGWTALAFWDRSVDSRPGSNSVFLIEGEYDFESAVEVAREAFPQIWQRFKFEVQRCLTAAV